MPKRAYLTHYPPRMYIYDQSSHFCPSLRLSSIKPKNLGFEKLDPKIGTNFWPSKKIGLHQNRDNWASQAKTRTQFPRFDGATIQEKNGHFVLTGQLPSNKNHLLEHCIICQPCPSRAWPRLDKSLGLITKNLADWGPQPLEEPATTVSQWVICIGLIMA